MRMWACIGLLAWTGAVAAAGPGPWLDPGEVSRVAGNGGLTVGVGPTGAVTVCRWPGPGSPNQVDPEYGLRWGVAVGGDVLWFPGASWEAAQRYEPEGTAVIETRAVLPDQPLAVTRRLFVHPEHDVLIDTLVVHGAERPPAIYWLADLRPCTAVIPEWPVTDWLQASRGFAAFTPDAGKTVYHFRPRNPGAAEWRRAERLMALQVPDDGWSGFAPGVWAASASPNEVAGVQCGVAGARDATFRQIRTGGLAGAPAAVGACHSVVSLTPSVTPDGVVATVLTAFGASRHNADEALASALAEGVDALAEEARVYWQDWLARASLALALDPEARSLCRRGLVAIALATDRRTGAVVRSPAALPLALDWPRHGAWMTLALDTAGYHDRAARHTRFYCEAVRGRDRRGAPMGTLSAALYADGTEGTPHLVLEADAGAWLLGSVWRHATYLDPPQRRDYLAGLWHTVEQATAFLVHWSDGRSGEPLHSFDPAAGKDRRSPRLLLTVFMGLDSALRIADALKRSAPEDWQRRRRELLRLIAINCVDRQTKQWRAAEVLPFWHRELASRHAEFMPTWDPIIEARLDALDATDGLAVAEAVSDAALLWQGEPGKLERLRPLLGRAAAPFDALISARQIVAASLVYSAGE